MVRWEKQSGFTIVELLIVVVVIAILAAISVVAFTSIQDRAKYSQALSNLEMINKAVNLYQAEYGTFPVANSWRYYCSYQSTPNDFIPNGTGYKLMYLRANVSSSFRDLVPQDMRDPVRWSSGTTWGYWTSDYATI
jgi:prepilin-type N-terminal cleavage/methylation domain-containing protein